MSVDNVIKERKMIMDSLFEETSLMLRLETSLKSDELESLKEIDLSNQELKAIMKIDKEAIFRTHIVQDILTEKFNRIQIRKQEHKRNVDSRKDHIRKLKATLSSEDDLLDEYQSILDPGGYGKKPRKDNIKPSKPPLNSLELHGINTKDWERWSGNQPEPIDLHKYIKSSSKKFNSSESISIPFRPLVWQQLSHIEQVADPKTEAADSEEEALKEDLVVQLSVKNVKLAVALKEDSVEEKSAEYSTFADFLKSELLFQSLSMSQIEMLSKEAQVVVFQDQQRVIPIGSTLTTVYFIKTGEVRVSPSLAHVRRGSKVGTDSTTETSSFFLKGGEVFGYDLYLSNTGEGGDKRLAPLAALSRTYNTNNLVLQYHSQYQYEAVGEVVTWSVPLQTFKALYLSASSIDLGPQVYPPAHTQLGLYLLSNGNVVSSDEIHFSHFAHVVKELKIATTLMQAESKGRNENYVEKAWDQWEKVTRLFNPEFDFEEVVDSMLLQCKQALSVDRIGLYIIDKVLNTMTLYVCQQAESLLARGEAAEGDSMDSGNSSKANAGIKMPLKGLAAYVALHDVILNIPNVYDSRFFDPSMDLRTGYLTKSMLCLPLKDNSSGNVIGVLQFINPFERGNPPNASARLFSRQDELLGNLLAQSISSKWHVMKLRSSANLFRSVRAITDPVRLHLSSAYITKSHRHVKCTVQLCTGTGFIGEPITTELLSTVAVSPIASGPSSSALIRCDFNFEVEFRGVSLSILPRDTRVLFQLHSKNNHPAGWCGFYLFTFDRALLQTAADGSSLMQMRLWDGGHSESASTVNNILEGIPFLLPGNPSTETETRAMGDMMVVKLPQMEASVLFDCDPQKVLRYSPVSSAGEDGFPWFFSLDLFKRAESVESQYGSMSAADQTKFRTMKSNVDIVELPTSATAKQPYVLSTESRQIVWKMRVALAQECMWSIPWILLSARTSVEASEVYKLLFLWKYKNKPSLSELLPLLDQRFSDGKVRSFVVNAIDEILPSPANTNAPQVDLTNILFMLTFALRFEKFTDSALARMLLRRAIRYPKVVGNMYFWYLNFLQQQDPVSGFQYVQQLRIYLRTVPSGRRKFLGDSFFVWHSIDRLHESTGGVVPQWRDQVNTACSVSVALTSHTTSALAHVWPREFYLPTSQSTENHTTGITLDHEGSAPSEANRNQSPFSLVFSVKRTDPFAEQRKIRFGLDIDVLVEMLYQQLLRALDLIWKDAGLAVRTQTYDFMPLIYPKANSTQMGGCLSACIPHGKTIGELIVSEVQTLMRATGKEFKKIEKMIKRLPVDLISKFLDSESRHKYTELQEFGANLPAPPNTGNQRNEAGRSQFQKSLVAFLVVNHVLGLKSSGCQDTVVTGSGLLYCRFPASVLAFEAKQYVGKKSVLLSKDKRGLGSVFYPPSFTGILDEFTDEQYDDFEQLLFNAFEALRKKASYLIWCTNALATMWQLPEDAKKRSIQMIKDRLMITVDENDAVLRFKDVLRRGMAADYSLSSLGVSFDQ